MHAYLSEFVTYLIKFIFLLAVSVGGVFSERRWLSARCRRKRSRKQRMSRNRIRNKMCKIEWKAF